jgi:hypothetical protein
LGGQLPTGHEAKLNKLSDFLQALVSPTPRLALQIGIPPDYVFGAPLSNQSLYIDTTFGSLGLTPGAYVYSWGSGPHADTFTLEIGPVGAASPVPESTTWAMMLIGFDGLGDAAVRRKKSGSRNLRVTAFTSRNRAPSPQHKSE